jgi:hypothetical protein
MRPAARRAFLLLSAFLVLVLAGEVFGRGLMLGRMFAFAEFAGFALGMLWKLVLVAVVLLWLRSALGKKQD